METLRTELLTKINSALNRIESLENENAEMKMILQKSGLLNDWQPIPCAANALNLNEQSLRKLIRDEKLQQGIHWKYKPGSFRYYLVNVSAVRTHFNQESVDKSV